MTTKRKALLLAVALCVGTLAACSSRDVPRQQSSEGGEQPSASQPALVEDDSGFESSAESSEDSAQEESSREESSGEETVSISVNIRNEMGESTDNKVSFRLRVPEGWQVSDTWNGQPSEGATIYDAQGDWIVQIPPGRIASQGGEPFSDIDPIYPEIQSTAGLTVSGYPAKLYITAGDKYLNGEVVASGYYYDYYIQVEDHICSVNFFAPDIVDSEQQKFEDILSTFQLS